MGNYVLHAGAAILEMVLVSSKPNRPLEKYKDDRENLWDYGKLVGIKAKEDVTGSDTGAVGDGSKKKYRDPAQDTLSKRTKIEKMFQGLAGLTTITVF